MRENVLRELAGRAAADRGFLRRAREDLAGTLAASGYRLTAEEMRLIEDLRHRTAGMSDEELAHALTSGLARHSGAPPTRPSAPSWRGSGPGAGPARPARPGR